MFYFFFFFIVPLLILAVIGGRMGAKLSLIGIAMVVSIVVFIACAFFGVILAEGFSMMPNSSHGDYFHLIDRGGIDVHLTTLDMWNTHSMGYAAFTWGYYLLYDIMHIIWQLNVYYPNGYLFFAEAIGIIWIIIHPFAIVVQVLVNVQQAERERAAAGY